ncbi:MAG: phosphopyruvate hydratase [Patescibacteria group bacterium]
MPLKIKKISALEILDSRGNPTVEVTVTLNNGLVGVSAVPSGASTGRWEAFELRDNDQSRYNGQGVLKAVQNVNTVINQALTGLDVNEQAKIDQLMIKLDGTKNKSKLGANAILGVSLACAISAAKANNLQLFQYLRQLYDNKIKEYKLPTPVVNVINGGKHGSTNINIQEFWLVPIKAKTFAEKLRQASEVFHNLGACLQEVGLDTDLGNEGGYSPEVKSHSQIFELLMQAIAKTKLVADQDMVLGIDAGASVFYDSAKELYSLPLEGGLFSAEELMDFYLHWMSIYPIHFLEDPFDQEDWNAWQQFTVDDYVRNNEIRVIGDDLFVTNVKRLEKGASLGAANTILIKPNQIGTLSETLATIRYAQKHKYQVMVSHRSGETEDTTIADLAVAVNADYIKIGSTARGERIVKYNRLLNIEDRLKHY